MNALNLNVALPPKQQTNNQAPPVKVKEAWTDKDASATANNNDENANISNDQSDEEDIYADSESLLDEIIKIGMPTAKATKSKSKIPQPKSGPVAGKPSHPATARLNESEVGSDDSTCSSVDDSGDLLQACIASGNPLFSDLHMKDISSAKCFSKLKMKGMRRK